MRPATAMFLSLLAVMPAAAQETDRRAEKQQLVADVLKRIDVRELLQTLVAAQVVPADAPDMTAEPWQGHGDAIAAARADTAEVIRRAAQRVDYQKICDEQYAPLIDDTFTADELRNVLAFVKTTEGQKLLKLVPEFADVAYRRAVTMVGALDDIRREVAEERNAKDPWSKTAGALLSLATACESFLTDNNDCPRATSLRELHALLSPTYILNFQDRDGFGGEIVYVVSADGAHYRLISGGEDGEVSWASRAIAAIPDGAPPVVINAKGADLIVQDGRFVQVPAAAQPAIEPPRER